MSLCTQCCSVIFEKLIIAKNLDTVKDCHIFQKVANSFFHFLLYELITWDEAECVFHAHGSGYSLYYHQNSKTKEDDILFSPHIILHKVKLSD